MTVQRIVHAVAGALVMLGLLLSLTVSQWFLLLPAFVGASLFQSAFTRFCLLPVLLRRMGVPDTCPPEARPF